MNQNKKNNKGGEQAHLKKPVSWVSLLLLKPFNMYEEKHEHNLT